MLTMEKTNEEMSTMRDNQFFGDIAQEENNKKECAMMGLIKNQIIVLNEELDVAYNRLGQVATDEENWSGKYERKMACKILQFLQSWKRIWKTCWHQLVCHLVNNKQVETVG